MTFAPSEALAGAIAFVFALLGALHVFWAAGGRWGMAAAVPETEGRAAFVPSRTATLAVAFALLGAALLVLARAAVLAHPLPGWLVRSATPVLGAVFVLRAVGDFRLVGFFKSVRGTRFAVLDTFLFSPLCLALGAGVLWLSFR